MINVMLEVYTRPVCIAEGKHGGYTQVPCKQAGYAVLVDEFAGVVRGVNEQRSDKKWNGGE
jgi:hypothetical protein